MAAPPLFDISNIDLNAVGVPDEKIVAVNPQTGDMRHLDRIIWTNADATEGLGVKNVRHDEFWVPGHIPGRPLLPGVLQIEACAQLCSVLQHIAHGPFDDKFVGFARCDKVAFRGQVVPGDEFLMFAKETSYRRGRFVADTQGYVKDKLVFEAKITGMLL